MSLIPFTPDPSDTSTTTINGVQFTVSALNAHHYALYTNNTISNGSECYLAFDGFKPSMLDNGTWIHATSCYVPYYELSKRGITSIVFGALFGLSILAALMNLKKHGAQHLREDKRFKLVGRRWQWYWMLFVSACAMIGLFTGVDVDRYYLQQMPIMLQAFFFTLTLPLALAAVWESTRHWGSWQERQRVDADPYGMPPSRRRTRIQFYTPLIFYALAWLTFFLTIPKRWTPIQKQNTPEQIRDIAIPAATDARAKGGALIAAFACLTIAFSLAHSLRTFHPGSPALTTAPKHLLLNLVFLATRTAYAIASSFSWSLSIANQHIHIAYPFALGYLPLLLILLAANTAGFRTENEDRQLIAQRKARGRMHDAELNLVKKPGWWNRNMAARFAGDEERLRQMATEVEGGGTRPTARAIEMGNMSVRQRSGSRSVKDPFRDESPQGEMGRRRGTGTQATWESEGTRAREASAKTEREEASRRSHTPPQQRIISMLDV